MTKIFNYPAEVLMAFGEAVKGKEVFRNWLIDNDFEPLAQLSLAIGNNRKAFKWLLDHYPQYAAFDRAIDNDTAAKNWLKKNAMGFEIIFADACAGNHDAIAWLAKNKLDIFIYLAKIIKNDIDERMRLIRGF